MYVSYQMNDKRKFHHTLILVHLCQICLEICDQHIEIHYRISDVLVALAIMTVSIVQRVHRIGMTPWLDVSRITVQVRRLTSEDLRIRALESDVTAPDVIIFIRIRSHLHYISASKTLLQLLLC